MTSLSLLAGRTVRPSLSHENKRMCFEIGIQEVFHVYLNKFESAVSHLFLIIISNDQITLIDLVSKNAQPPRKYLLTLCFGLNKSLKMSSQNLSI